MAGIYSTDGSISISVTGADAGTQGFYAPDGSMRVSVVNAEPVATPPSLIRESNAGIYYTTIGVSSLTTSALTDDRLYMSPLFVSHNSTFNRIGCEVTTGGAGNVRMALYRDTGAVHPGELIVDGGNVDTTALGEKEATIDIELTPGLYWMALIADNATAVFRVINVYDAPLGRVAPLSPAMGLALASAFGAHAADHSGTSINYTGSTMPLMWLRRV